MDTSLRGNYQVCIGADTLTDYKIYEDNIDKNCGFAYNNGPNNSTKDYAIFAQGAIVLQCCVDGSYQFYKRRYAGC